MPMPEQKYWREFGVPIEHSEMCVALACAEVSRRCDHGLKELGRLYAELGLTMRPEDIADGATQEMCGPLAAALVVALREAQKLGVRAPQPDEDLAWYLSHVLLPVYWQARAPE